MPADLSKPFSESCCDGGECATNHESAQSCGCDKGADWICQVHRDEMDTKYSYTNVTSERLDVTSEWLNDVINKSWNFAKRIKDHTGHEQNALIGLAAEAGEVLDIGKKKWFHTEKPDSEFRNDLLSELGDVGFYWLKAIDVLGFTVEEVYAYNRKKLESRHPELGKVETRFGPNSIKG